jgi:mannose-6-phosphate isomerase-like protein (cupin superfamily)
MKRFFSALVLLLFCVTARTQSSAGGAVVVNSHNAKWTHDSGDPPGAESLDLRTDVKTGAAEFFARYPGGFAFKPHSHKANERFMLVEGRAAVEVGDVKTSLDPGGFAYFPAGQTHKISCVSSTPCMWYLGWDGRP